MSDSHARLSLLSIQNKTGFLCPRKILLCSNSLRSSLLILNLKQWKIGLFFIPHEIPFHFFSLFSSIRVILAVIPLQELGGVAILNIDHRRKRSDAEYEAPTMQTHNALSTNVTQPGVIAPSPIPCSNTLCPCSILRQAQEEERAQAILQELSAIAEASLAQSTSGQAIQETSPVTSVPSQSFAMEQTLPYQETVQTEPASALDVYTTNLTEQAKQGKLRPFVGREEELEDVLKMLCRRDKRNPCLIGEPGVGKTTIVEALAQRIVSGHVPERLKNMKVIRLDSVYLVACHEIEVVIWIEKFGQRDDKILFLDELHVLVKGHHNNMNQVQIWKPVLARGNILCIGATTVDGYKKIEKDSILRRLFNAVKVHEPSVDETIRILKGIHGKYETHHRLRYTNEALVAAAKLSNRYISGRFLPDKAIDLIDAAGSDVRFHLEQEHQGQDEIVRMPDGDVSVTEFDIQRIISSWTKIPLKDLSRTESQRLLKLEDSFRKNIIGQEAAIKAISSSIRRARVGLKSPDRPIASFLFTGPTGVGKTKLAKILARECFVSESAMVRIDMGEFMDRHSVSNLTGPPAGYFGSDKGGVLTEAVRSQPHSLCLFDEIEKAHVDVLNIMLQILDDGRLSDNQGVVDFSNTLIIMTSNVGSNIFSQGIGVFDDHLSNNIERDQIIDERFHQELKRKFRVEFLNRFDEIIVFKQLTKLEIKKIAELMLEQLNEMLKDREIKLEVTDRFKDWLLEQGYNPAYGARELRRAITRVLEDKLAEKLLKEEIRQGDSATVDVNDDGKVVINV